MNKFLLSLLKPSLMVFFLSISLSGSAQFLFVDGAGSFDANGFYVANGQQNGKNKYSKSFPDFSIYWYFFKWVIVDGSDNVYYENYTDVGVNPPQTGWEVSFSNYFPPAPTLSGPGSGPSGPVTYTFTGSGDYFSSSNWENNQVPPQNLPAGSSVIIDGSGPCNYSPTPGNNLYVQGSSFTVNANKVFNINGGRIVIASSPFEINGTVNVGVPDGIEPTFDYNLNIRSGGVLNINSGGKAMARGVDGCTIYSGGILNIGSGGTFESYGYGGTVVNNGTIKGSGVFLQNGIFTNSASIAPGASPGTLTFLGDLNLGTGTYNCEINGTELGSTYDWLAIGGTATIGGSSKLHLIFSVPIVSGTTFNVLSADNILSGSFSSGNVTFANTLTGNVTAVSAMNVGNIVQVTATTPLPVELVSFTGKTKEGGVLLQWETASEQNNEGFEIQRSADGKNWDDIAFVPGHGNTQVEQSYTYTDERPLPGLNYYRLLQMDYDGKSEYSKIVSVEMKNGGSGIHFFPNPATGSVTLSLETDYSGEATLILYDLIGKQMQTAILSLEGGTFRTDIGLGSLPAGVYVAQVQAGGVLWRERLIIK